MLYHDVLLIFIALAVEHCKAGVTNSLPTNCLLSVFRSAAYVHYLAKHDVAMFGTTLHRYLVVLA